MASPPTSYPYPSPSQLEALAGAVNNAASSPNGNSVSNANGIDYTHPDSNSNNNLDQTPRSGSASRSDANRKRRADGSNVSSSSRGVANLTAEQLAKKRANDREAQRAIRERTRSTIDDLHRRIRELESQQHHQELQNALRARDAVVAENEELRRRIQRILAIAQLPGMPQGLSELALATSQQSPLPLPVQSQSPQLDDRHALRDDLQDGRPLQEALQGSFNDQLQEAAHQPENVVASTATEEATATSLQSFNQQHLHPDLRSLQSAQGAPTAEMGVLNGIPAADDANVAIANTTAAGRARKRSKKTDDVVDEGA